MNARTILIRYRVIGTVFTILAVSFIGGFIVGLGGYAGTSLVDVANAAGWTFGGIWLLIGGGYELHALLTGRYRTDNTETTEAGEAKQTESPP